MSETTAWLAGITLVVLGLLSGAIVAALALFADVWLGIGPIAGVVAIFVASGSFLGKAQYMRAQRVLSDKADRL